MARPNPSTLGPRPPLPRAGSGIVMQATARDTLKGAFLSPITLSTLLILLVAAAFSPVFSSGFIDFDDDLYVTANPYVQAGLTWTGLKWAFQTTAASNWHPVTWLSHMLDCQVYGILPWGHHLTSVLLHGVNTVLLFLLLKRLTKALWPSFLVAGLFGLHPLHVESVAWVAERKDVLSTLFFLLTVAAYGRYARFSWSQTRKHDMRRTSGSEHSPSYAVAFYLLALTLFALGLMAKPMLVSLPLVLLLLDFWPLKRHPLPLNRLVLEKVPFFALAAISCIVTYLVQKQSGAVTIMGNLSIGLRLENAAVSYCRYLAKMFWPVDLTLFYPFPAQLKLVLVVLAIAFLATVTMLVLVSRRRYPWLFVGWLWFVITLVPVIGIIQAGGQAMADRYTYISLIGIFIVLAWGLQTMTAAWRAQQFGSEAQAGVTAVAPAARSGKLTPAFSWFVVPVVVLCVPLTFHQARYWQTSESLWAHALAVTRNNFLAHINLGLELERQGRLDEASDQFRSAIKLRPGEAKAHANLANVLCRQNHVAEGIIEFEEATRLNPNLPAVRYNLAVALCRQGRFAEGITQFEAVLKLRPGSPQTHFELAMALLASQRRPEAVTHLEHALQLRPNYPEARRQLQLLKQSPNP
jgi:tetratricopeptide (TPR) repeat protein